jgi:CheY-like chemotaxis protein
VSSASEALESAASFQPDVVLTDVEMPMEDGYGLLRRLRALDGAVARSPVAALTAYAGPDDRERMLSAGFDLHIPKPIRPAELVAAIAGVCGRATGAPPSSSERACAEGGDPPM